MMAPPGPKRMTFGVRPLYSARKPSSLYTVAIDPKVVRYFTSPLTGCGPCIRLFATSNGILITEPKVPALCF